MKFFITADGDAAHERIYLVDNDYNPLEKSKIAEVYHNALDGTKIVGSHGRPVTQYSDIYLDGGKRKGPANILTDSEREDNRLIYYPKAITKRNVKAAILDRIPKDGRKYVLLLSRNFGEFSSSMARVELNDATFDYLNDKCVVNSDFVRKNTRGYLSREDMICFYNINDAVDAFIASANEVVDTAKAAETARKERADRLKAALHSIVMR